MCDYSLHTIASRPTTADMLVRNLKMGTEVLYIEIVMKCESFALRRNGEEWKLNELRSRCHVNGN